MNQKATYEIAITEKLRQLPVPDMRDAIWSRIEQQLDLDMPEDDEPESPDSPNNSSWRKTGWKVGPFAVIVAIITLFFINQNNRSNPNNTSDRTPIKTETVSPQTNDPTSPPSTKNTVNTPPVVNNGSTPVNGSDSVFNQPMIFNQPLDSSVNLPVFIPPVVQNSSQSPPKQDSVPNKKPRGVTGIKDQDYHITLKKDSVP